MTWRWRSPSPPNGSRAAWPELWSDDITKDGGQVCPWQGPDEPAENGNHLTKLNTPVVEPDLEEV
jgi:hypothetical protein